LPDIDEAQILAMLEGTLANTGAFVEEAVQEVFEFLRPRNSRYKTNTEFEIRKRVILFAVENKWGSPRGSRNSGMCGEAAKPITWKSGLLHAERGCNDNGHGFEID